MRYNANSAARVEGLRKKALGALGSELARVLAGRRAEPGKDQDTRRGEIPMTRRRWFASLPLAALFAAASRPAAAQFGDKKKKKKERTRTVKGLVTDERENPIRGAVVQLKNTRTLVVKSFFSTQEGRYYFHNLNSNVDYEIKAKYQDAASRTRTVSTFDDRPELIYNFRLKLSE